MNVHVDFRLTGEQLGLLEKHGYRRTSNKHGHVTRIDRKDWLRFMAKKHAPWDFNEGTKWVMGLGLASAADHYRRVHSKDTLVLHPDDAKCIMSSNHDPIGFVEIDEDEKVA